MFEKQKEQLKKAIDNHFEKSIKDYNARSYSNQYRRPFLQAVYIVAKSNQYDAIDSARNYQDLVKERSYLRILRPLIAKKAKDWKPLSSDGSALFHQALDQNILSKRQLRRALIHSVLNSSTFGFHAYDKQQRNFNSVIVRFADKSVISSQDITFILRKSAQLFCSKNPDSEIIINDGMKDLIKDLAQYDGLLSEEAIQFVMDNINPNSWTGNEIIKSLAAKDLITADQACSITLQSIRFDDRLGLESMIAMQDSMNRQGYYTRSLEAVAKQIPDAYFGTEIDGGDAIVIYALQYRAGLIDITELDLRLTNLCDSLGQSPESILEQLEHFAPAEAAKDLKDIGWPNVPAGRGGNATANISEAAIDFTGTNQPIGYSRASIQKPGLVR